MKLTQREIHETDTMIREQIAQIIIDGSIFTVDGTLRIVDKILEYLESIGYQALPNLPEMDDPEVPSGGPD